MNVSYDFLYTCCNCLISRYETVGASVWNSSIDYAYNTSFWYNFSNTESEEAPKVCNAYH